ncbi:putative signal transducing protein [Siansivirga zeaxanthinifaciens]|uniref:DUF2007 domain-containing protein n=1 Tax=Siansivirga zeaxanthinifaciens CC-SAMT-1 TaxID=1454006 RepID=A0A0C5VZ53_9FLAO|nr:DUF2007 domain-containing protein [Siansivirga zeaxanthinifaciens]AJR04331.1 hypothetical protein AW14_12380 [Siansivirga zeaxanthinifaciens CC-SAMT-1]
MSHSSYTKIFTGNFIMVQRIVSELKELDIIPVIKDQTESARLGGFGGGILPGFQEVYINNDELEKASEIIKNISENSEYQ